MDESSGKGSMIQAHRSNGVVMDIATFKVSHAVGIDKDTTALQAKKKGAHNVPSGHGGVFPAGVNVGKIISMSNGDYYVQPLPNPQKLRFVSILSSTNLENRKKSSGFAPLQEDQNKINLKGFNKFSN